MATQPDCKEAPGVKAPVIDPTRCEGSGACLEICPYRVFALRRPEARAFVRLPLLTLLRVATHGGRQAIADRPRDCRACELCVSACPTAAIAIEPVDR
jgi:NAD-dependent dihydropyrimidine dehydrogenase PreA subunit